MEKVIRERYRDSRGFFFSSRRRHTRLQGDWSSDVCSSDLDAQAVPLLDREVEPAAQRGDRAPAAVYHDHGIEARQRPCATREPAGAIELVEIGRASCRERV